MAVTIAATGRVDINAISRFLIQTLAALPPGTTILLRRPLHEPARAFETLVHSLCVALWLPVEWFEAHEGRGRAGTYERDYRLVERSSAVVAFFAPEEDPMGSSGTAHLLISAIARDVPVFAWTYSDSGVERIGEYGQAKHSSLTRMFNEGRPLGVE
jgi:hypothetical protein